MAVRITCISKDAGNHQNPHEGITHVGWVNEQTHATGNSTRAAMIKYIEIDHGQAYVKDAHGRIAYVGVVTPLGRSKYLRTYADRVWTDNLLSLPEC
jgi:Protein of unknown function (DUF3892)